MLRTLLIMLAAIFTLYGYDAGIVYASAGQQNHSATVDEAAQRWHQLDELSERIYQQSVEGDLLQALQTMNKVEELLGKSAMFDHMTVEQIEAITDTIISVKGELHRAQIQQEQLVHAASKLRLVMDAVTHPKKAMWLQYEQVLHQEMADMLQSENKAAWDQRSKAWVTHVDRILPAITIQRPVETVEMMRSLMALVEQTYISKVDMEQAKSALRDAEEMWMTALFGKSGDTATWASVGELGIPWRFVMWIGCIVSVSLAYVGYVKYRQRDEEIHSGPWTSLS